MVERDLAPEPNHRWGTAQNRRGRGVDCSATAAHPGPRECGLSDRAAGHWRGYIPPDRRVDMRNAEPILRVHEEPQPQRVIRVGRVELELPEDLTPTAGLADFKAVQAYRLAIFAEKVSMEPILSPISEDYGAELLLPPDEASDPMIYALAQAADEDGRLALAPRRPVRVVGGGLAGYASVRIGQGKR
jgi:hypothetical protein